MQTHISSFFSKKNPLAIVNYNSYYKHYNYVLPFCEVGGYDNIMYRAQRNLYRERLNEWMKEEVTTYNDPDYDDEDYGYDEHEEYCHEDQYSNTTNGEIIRDIYYDILSCLDKNNYTITNSNLFKEDLVYMLYRLTNLR